MGAALSRSREARWKERHRNQAKGINYEFISFFIFTLLCSINKFYFILLLGSFLPHPIQLWFYAFTIYHTFLFFIHETLYFLPPFNDNNNNNSFINESTLSLVQTENIFIINYQYLSFSFCSFFHAHFHMISFWDTHTRPRPHSQPPSPA